MRKVIPIFAIIIALFAVGMAAAQSAATVVITPSTNSVTVGDPVELTVTVTHPAGTQVLMPALEANWGDFVVRSQSPVNTVDNGDGTATSTQAHRRAPLCSWRLRDAPFDRDHCRQQRPNSGSGRPLHSFHRQLGAGGRGYGTARH
ncbi:MAG: hypothetical protein M5U34_39290 [Chloroflexi bacterium]|nr:hypothetical protein [Chloroflexota bacterium]